jgi:hypothetical protein
MDRDIYTNNTSIFRDVTGYDPNFRVVESSKESPLNRSMAPNQGFNEFPATPTRKSSKVNLKKGE